MSTDTTPPTRRRLTDRNGEVVHAFSLQMENLGHRLLADKLLAMLDSGAWLDFKDGLGAYRFLPGEFDYFLTQWGVARDDVLAGVRDIEAKARLEAAMDERRTGEDGYRRRVEDVRREVPARPGAMIEPYGYTKREAAHLGQDRPRHREALGKAVRRWTVTGGVTTIQPSQALPRGERLTQCPTTFRRRTSYVGQGTGRRDGAAREAASRPQSNNRVMTACRSEPVLATRTDTEAQNTYGAP